MKKAIYHEDRQSRVAHDAKPPGNVIHSFRLSMLVASGTVTQGDSRLRGNDGAFAGL
jgi:hypothetical protein